MKKLLILGAGTGGTIMANKMRKDLPRDEWDITIIDQFKTHYYQPGFLFIPVFFDSLEEYMKKRNLSLKQVPLKICDWCHDPFFGNRYDQRFCSKIHGQRWHAKHSYEKSK